MKGVFPFPFSPPPMSTPVRKRAETYCLLGIIFGLAAGNIWVRAATVQQTYRFAGHERALRKLEQEIQHEKVRWIKLSSPQRLEKLAATLGLQPPRLDQRVRYRMPQTTDRETSPSPSRR